MVRATSDKRSSKAWRVYVVDMYNRAYLISSTLFEYNVIVRF